MNLWFLEVGKGRWHSLPIPAGTSPSCGPLQKLVARIKSPRMCGEAGTKELRLGAWGPVVLSAGFSFQPKLPLVGPHSLWPACTLVWSLLPQNDGVCVHVFLPLFRDVSSCSSYLCGRTADDGPEWICCYLCLHPDFLLHVTVCSLCVFSSPSSWLWLLSFLPPLVSPCALRFYLSGFQIIAFFKYMTHVFVWIPNTCWLWSITWSAQYFLFIYF